MDESNLQLIDMIGLTSIFKFNDNHSRFTWSLDYTWSHIYLIASIQLNSEMCVTWTLQKSLLEIVEMCIIYHWYRLEEPTTVLASFQPTLGEKKCVCRPTICLVLRSMHILTFGELSLRDAVIYLWFSIGQLLLLEDSYFRKWFMYIPSRTRWTYNQQLFILTELISG